MPEGIQGGQSGLLEMMHTANDNQPQRSGAERFRDTAIAVIVILLIAGATGSFNVQPAGATPAHTIQLSGG